MPAKSTARRVGPGTERSPSRRVQSPRSTAREPDRGRSHRGAVWSSGTEGAPSSAVDAKPSAVAGTDRCRCRLEVERIAARGPSTVSRPMPAYYLLSEVAVAARSPDVPAVAPILDRRRCVHGVRDRSRLPDRSGCALISREVYHVEILDAKR